MKFLELGSEASYDFKDGLVVKVQRILNCAYGNGNSFEALDLKEGEIIEAGWMNTENKKAKGKVLKIWQGAWDFEDEINWMIEIQKI